MFPFNLSRLKFFDALHDETVNAELLNIAALPAKRFLTADLRVVIIGYFYINGLSAKPLCSSCFVTVAALSFLNTNANKHNTTKAIAAGINQIVL